MTKEAARLHRILNRYKDILPCKLIYAIPPDNLCKIKSMKASLNSVVDQSLVLLGHQWPSAIDDPEPAITVSTDFFSNFRKSLVLEISKDMLGEVRSINMTLSGAA